MVSRILRSEGAAAGHFGVGVGDFAEVGEKQDERECSSGEEEERGHGVRV